MTLLVSPITCAEITQVSIKPVLNSEKQQMTIAFNKKNVEIVAKAKNCFNLIYHIATNKNFKGSVTVIEIDDVTREESEFEYVADKRDCLSEMPDLNERITNIFYGIKKKKEKKVQEPLVSIEEGAKPSESKVFESSKNLVKEIATIEISSVVSISSTKDSSLYKTKITFKDKQAIDVDMGRLAIKYLVHHNKDFNGTLSGAQLSTKMNLSGYQPPNYQKLFQEALKKA